MAQDADTPQDNGKNEKSGGPDIAAALGIDIHPNFVTRRWKRILVIGFALILLVGAGFMAFLNTAPGTDFVRDTVNRQDFGTLDVEIGNIEGSLYGTPVFTDVILKTYDPVLDPDTQEPVDGARGKLALHVVIDEMEADADLLLYLRSSLPDVIVSGLDPGIARLIGLDHRETSSELRLREVDIKSGRLVNLVSGEEVASEGSPIPDLPVTIETLKVANFDILPGVLDPEGNLPEEAIRVALDTNIILRDGRALAKGSGALGDDRFAMNINFKPAVEESDPTEFDLFLDVTATQGGPITALAGLDGDFRLQVKGDGQTRDGGARDNWLGHALASRGDERIGAFRIVKRGERFEIAGLADPTPFVEGIPAEALGSQVAVGLAGTLSTTPIANPQSCGEGNSAEGGRGDAICQLFNGGIALRGQGLRASGDGAFDLTNLRFQDFAVTADLLDPNLLGETATLEGLALSGTVNGALSEIDFDHVLEAQRIAAGTTLLENVRQEGVARVRGGDITLLVDADFGQIVTGNPMADERLANGTVAGEFRYSGDSVVSDAIDIAFPGATARLSLDANLASQSLRLRGPAAINRVPVETLGVVNGGGQIDFAYAGTGGWTLDADFDAAVPLVTNDTIANLAGPRLDLAGGVSLGSAGPITFRQVRLDSRDLDLVLDGRVDEGSTSVAGRGRHTQYGAFTVDAALRDNGPEATLVFADPLPAAGLKDVRVALSPTVEGFAIATEGQSMLGAFEGQLGLVSPADGPTVIAIEQLTVSETLVTGDLQLADGGALGELALVGGGVDGTIILAPRGGGQGFAVNLNADNARFGGATPISIARARLNGSGVFAGGIADSNTTAEATMTAQGVSYGSIFIGRMAANAQLRNGQGEVTASLSGRRGSRFALQLNGQIAPERIAVAARGEYGGERISMPRRAVLTPDGDGWALARTQVNFDGGTAMVEGNFGGPRTRFALGLDDVPLSLVDVAVADLGLGGTISGSVVYDAPARGLPSGEAEVKIDDLTRSGLVLASRPIDLSLVGKLTADRLEARAVLDDDGGQRGRVQMLVSNMPSSGDIVSRLQSGDLLAQLRYQGPAAALWRLAAIDAFDFTGPTSVAADVTGTLADPQLRGSLASDGLRVQSALSGTDIRDVSVRGNFAGSRLRLTRFAGTASNGGAVSGSGFIDLANLGAGRGPEIDLRVAARNAKLLDAQGLSATLTGPLRIVSNGVGGTIAGRVQIDRASWKFGTAAEDVSLPVIATREVNLPFDIAPAAAPSAPWRYLINATAPSRVDVDGMGLDTEWSADIRLRGTTDDPRIGGEARVVRGFYTFAGTRFELTRGRIDFDENGPIDPQLDIIAETESAGVDVEVSVQGNGLNPEISFSSNPALPEEEILARLLFGGSITDLSATDAVQLGAALASLRGGGGGLDPINQLRTAIGLDRLRIVGADPALNRGTGVALGKNFGRRFYVELITDGRGYTATEVEFRVSSWLSLLAAVSSIGRESAVVEVSRDY